MLRVLKKLLQMVLWLRVFWESTRSHQAVDMASLTEPILDHTPTRPRWELPFLRRHGRGDPLMDV